MFSWLKWKRSASSDTATHNEDDVPPQVRKPKHAFRDARMSVPVAEREYYETIQARKRSAHNSFMNGKGKARSPLAYNSGEYEFKMLSHCHTRKADCCLHEGMSSLASTAESSEPTSHSSTSGSKTDLWGLWTDGPKSSRQDSTAPTSLAESSRDAAARGARAEDCVNTV